MWHIQRTVPDWTRSLQYLPDGALVKATENYQIFREVKQINGNLLTCARMVRDHWQVYDGGWFVWETAKRRAREWFDAFIDGTFRTDIAQYCDAVQFHNEVWANSQNADERAERDAANAAAVHIWNTEYRNTLPGDIRLCLSTAAVGNKISRDSIKLAIETDNLVGYHPYSLWQNKQNWDGDWVALSGLWSKMEHEYDLSPNWIFPEAGPFESAVTGWRASECLGGDRALYVDAVRAWLRNVQQTAAYKEGRLWGFALFTTGSPSPQWNSFETSQPELDMLAQMIGQEWNPGTKPPDPDPDPDPDCKGLPREDYRRVVNVIPSSYTDEQAVKVFRQQWEIRQEDGVEVGRETVTGSYDEAGIGDLSDKTARLWGIDPERWQVFNDWYAEHYPGTKVEFADLQGDTTPPQYEVAYIVDDLPKHAAKKYLTRPLSVITTLTIHHTVSPPDRSIASIAAYHVNTRGWPGIGYHFVINDTGDIYQTNDLHTVSYHAGSARAPGDENLWSIGIALQGDFTNAPPPQAQLDAAAWLIKQLRDDMPLGDGVLDVVGHRDMPGASTACPGNTYGDWIGSLG